LHLMRQGLHIRSLQRDSALVVRRPALRPVERRGRGVRGQERNGIQPELVRRADRASQFTKVALLNGASPLDRDLRTNSAQTLDAGTQSRVRLRHGANLVVRNSRSV